MARVRKGSHSHSSTCTPARVHPRNELYRPFSFQPKLVLIYRPRRDGRLRWPWLGGWLHTEINVRHRELNPDAVTHPSTNGARRKTSLIETNALPIRQITKSNSPQLRNDRYMMSQANDFFLFCCCYNKQNTVDLYMVGLVSVVTAIAVCSSVHATLANVRNVTGPCLIIGCRIY